MKLLIFGTTEDEQRIILEMNHVIRLEKLTFIDGVFSMERIDKVAGYDAIWIMTNSRIGEVEAEALQKVGVKYIISRATGTDHLNLSVLKKYGIRAANVPGYSPNAISEYTILLFLTVLRKMKKEQEMIKQRDFSIHDICGKEIRMMTVGVIGAGRIGRLTIKALKGLGAGILVCSPSVNEEIAKIAKYVPLDTLLEQSDAIILHCPLTNENYHLIREETLAKCKDGLVLVNTARGGLTDGKSVLAALKSGKLSGFAMDVYEHEDVFIRKDYGGKPVEDPVFEELLQREDVVYTSHVSFLTDQALYEIVRISMENALEYQNTGTCKNEVTDL